MENNLFASLTTTPGKGPGPYYQIFIDMQGYSVLNGTKNVPYIGKYKCKLQKQDMNKIIQKAQEIKFKDMKAQYDQGISLVGLTTIQVNLNGVIKKVQFRVGHPKQLEDFDKVFLSLIKNKKWQKIQ